MIKRIGLLTSGGDCQASECHHARSCKRVLPTALMTWKFTDLMMDIRD